MDVELVYPGSGRSDQTSSTSVLKGLNPNAPLFLENPSIALLYKN